MAQDLIWLFVYLIAWCALWGRIGYRHYAKKMYWVYADLFWLIVGVTSLIGVAYSINHDLEAGSKSVLQTFEKVHRTDIHMALRRATDQHCSSTQPANKTASTRKAAICQFLSHVGSGLVVPTFNHVDTVVLLEEADNLCLSACPSEVEQVVKALKTYQATYLKNRAVYEENGAIENGKRAPWKIVSLGLLILGFGPRFGKAIAELRRERLAASK